MKTPSAIRRAMPARRDAADTFWLTALGLLIALSLPVPAQASPRPKVANDSDQLAWRLFAAINRSQGRTRTRGLAPVAWETWSNTQEIYREDGADPGAWCSLPSQLRSTASETANEARFEAAARANPELMSLSNVRHIVAGRMLPGIPMGIDAQLLIESRMNRIAFDYVRAHALYNLEGQMHAVASGQALKFPRGTLEVKASWRPIAASDAQRYRTLWVRLDSGETRLYGLTALNVAAKVLPTRAHDATRAHPGTHAARWLWASFEHVDNARRVAGEGWQLPSRDAYACPGAPGACDRVPAGLGLEATVWQNYRLRGTQTNYVDAQGGPERLGNSELEAGLQSTSSCMTCHARAALAVADGRPRRLSVFETAERRGSIGVPKPAWFRADGLDYRSLDFVWSLSQAKPRRMARLANSDRPELSTKN